MSNVSVCIVVCVLWMVCCCLWFVYCLCDVVVVLLIVSCCLCVACVCLMFGLSVVWVLCCCVWCDVVWYILLTCQVSNLLQTLSGFVRRFDTCLSLCVF